MKTRIFFLLLTLSALSVKAQTFSGINSDGRDFYIGFVFPSFNKNPNVTGGNFHTFFSTSAIVATIYDSARVGVSFFLSNGQETPKKIYIAKNSVQIPLNDTTNPMRLSEPGEKPEYKACHITSDVPISITYFSTGANSGGSYLALPTAGLGKNYVIPSYNDNPDAVGAGVAAQTEPSSGFFLVIGIFDSTNVTITPNSRTAGGHVGVHGGAGALGIPQPFTIILQRGQCYWVKGDASDETEDISGSLVVSTKPIGVLAGHEDAFIGSAPSSRILEGRDFMIEQVIPSESWDSTGYVNIPLEPTQPVDQTSSGYGQGYRSFSNDPNRANIVAYDACNGQFDFSTILFNYPIPERINVGCPIDFSSSRGKKFGIMCYESRDQGTNEPYPAESMMSIVPMSRWKKSYSFYVPLSTSEILQDYYINVIGEKNDIQNNIVYSHDGSPFQILSALALKASFPSIPNHPELLGKRYTVHPGSYYLKNTRTKIDSTFPIDTILRGAFMVYRYDMRSLDPDGDLGDFDGDDFFFANANPAGMLLFSGKPSNFSIKVDSQCAKWNICARSPLGIRSISLLNDSMGIQFSPGKVSFNCHLDSGIDPLHLGDVELPGTDTSLCFTVFIDDPSKISYAALMITDNAGNEQVVDLHGGAPNLQIIPSAATIDFGVHGKGTDSCIQIIIKNTGLIASPAISSLSLSGDPLFSISSVTPALPVMLQPGDSVVIKTCFAGSDTNLVRASISLNIECFTKAIALQGEGTAPIILAGDINFGDVIIDSVVCKTVSIKNVGGAPLILDKNFSLGDKLHFSVADVAQFPLTIQPGGVQVITICYSPSTLTTDTSRIIWLSNENNHSQKDYTLLSGRGINPRIMWNVPAYTYFADTNTSSVHRFYLKNTSVNNIHADLVQIVGPDSLHFTIIADQLGNIPLSNFTLNGEDSIWVDIRFDPNLSGPPPGRYADRHALAIAMAIGEKSAILNLTATFAKSGVQTTSSPEFLSIRPNPAKGNSIIITFAPQSESSELIIYDVLGREMFHRNISGAQEIELPIRNLQNGIYYARLVANGKILTEKFEVMR